MKKKIKIILSAIYTETNLLNIIKLLRKQRHIILTFHRITDNENSLNCYDTCPVVRKKTFIEIIKYTNSLYKIVSLDYMNKNIDSKEPMAAITFDDGWRDNYDYAYPFLKDMNIPATIFVTTGKINSNIPFWQQEIGNCFEYANSSNSETNYIQSLKTILRIEKNELLSKDTYIKIIKKLKELTLDEINEILKNLKRKEYIERLFLSENEINEMYNNGISFGAHTVNHVILPNESVEVIEKELSDSKKTLESILNNTIDSIAYPNGNYSKKTIELIRSCGYHFAYTTTKNYVSSKTSSFEIPRVDPGWSQTEDTKATFNKYLYNWGVK